MRRSICKTYLTIHAPAERDELQRDQRWSESVESVWDHGGVDICHGKREPQQGFEKVNALQVMCAYRSFRRQKAVISIPNSANLGVLGNICVESYAPAESA
jgi:hypothetical protein